MKNAKYLWIVLCGATLMASCRGDKPAPAPPAISFENGGPVFRARQGATLVITPTVANGDGATYVWSSGGEVIGREPSLAFRSDEEGSVYVSLRVSNAGGADEAEIRIDVLALLAPQITMAVPEGGFTVVEGGELLFSPEVIGDAMFLWTVDGVQVAVGREFTFSPATAGLYHVVFTATGDDGVSRLEFDVRVCTPDEMAFEWMFEQTTYNISLGRTVFIRPFRIRNAFDAVYSWRIDGGGVVREGTECSYAYTPSMQGQHTVTIAMNNSYGQLTKTFTVNVCPPEGTWRRPLSPSSSAEADHGYFFLPAPSQHINRGASVVPFADQAAVNAHIYNRPGSTEYGGSLGAWGGCLVAGFDHSVANSGGYDLEIEGNAFPGSSEPGIVWVMQDENGNGLPDDTWYELKGSAYGAPGYIRDYAVTYFRGADRSNIAWTDNHGNSGTIDYMHEHTPPTMYPRWIAGESYTLVGSRLPSRTREVTPGYWSNDDFEWGYVDNYSPVDMLRSDGNPNAAYVGNHLRISDAVTHDGQPAGLQYIDFVKVQTGLNVKAGWLGENSTEVAAIRDYNMIK
ncbi:MAG: cell surface protein [Rikenellaceae bacterium]|jgi:PKD repeat protein|nr:cell surface protein [Rikenellaceae bacterium]